MYSIKTDDNDNNKEFLDKFFFDSIKVFWNIEFLFQVICFNGIIIEKKFGVVVIYFEEEEE